MKTFGEWVAETHPDVRLLPWQERWANMMQNDQMPVVLLGKGTGKTFIMRLWREYVAATRTTPAAE